MPSAATPGQSALCGHRALSRSATGTSRRKPRPKRSAERVDGSTAPIAKRVTAVLVPPSELESTAASTPSPSPARQPVRAETDPAQPLEISLSPMTGDAGRRPARPQLPHGYYWRIAQI